MTIPKNDREKLPCPTPGCPNMRTLRRGGGWPALCMACNRRAISTKSWSARAGHEAQRAQLRAEKTQPIRRQ